MEQRVISRAKLESDVREAVLRQKFVPYFQPFVDLSSGKLSGFEILARWDQDEHRHVGPGTFVPIIDQFGMMAGFAKPVLQKAICAALEWSQDCVLAFNVSANGICNNAACDSILEIMHRFGFSSDRLVVEVSEMAAVQDEKAASYNMNRMRDLGISFALDDFGVGYSGLNYLRTLSFDILKLDRSFVSTMPECSESKKIVHSVLSLAEQFKMETVAEGIETEEVLELVKSAGFTHGQGYYFGKPVPQEIADELALQKRTVPLRA